MIDVPGLLHLPLDSLLARLNTGPLQRGTAPTRALVVLNGEDTPLSGRVRFRASFPVSVSVGAQPVTVRDADGAVAASRLVESVLEERADLPPDRLLWTLTLEFACSDIPANGWRAYSAAFEGRLPESRSDDEAFWRASADAGLPVYETDCHAGDLPLTGVRGM